MNLLQDIVVVGAQATLFSEGLATLVVGIGVVFVALILLIIILEAMGKVFDYLGKKEEARKISDQVLVRPEFIEPPISEIQEIDDLELVAVITATIAASMGTSAEGLQVRSIRRSNNPWGMSARTEQLYK